ncbi:MAG: hypothetical protein A4E53_00144 [Pelotomaculum sp. PtaB.Bin104]|nr:MAG: hypothetical protein A4E53_00144 [Pelotomaculum sp. PtaB.Bin104]
MPAIPIADKATLDAVLAYVDELNTRLTDTRAGKLDLVGTTGDAPGTDSIFARLAQIAGYVDQVEGYVDTLETNLGTTAQDASSSGTALQRLAYIIASMIPQQPQSTYIGSYSTTSTSLQTALSVSGKGVLIGVMIKLANSVDGQYPRLKITLDGTVVLDGRGIYSAGYQGPYFDGFNVVNGTSRAYQSNTSNTPIFIPNLMYPFKTSLLLQALTSNSSNEVTVKWVYGKE